jgi:PAS domain S-box-containing protein
VSSAPIDYHTAFELAPIGLVLSRQRLMIDCNRQALAIFGATREQMVGQSFECLYPTQAEYERTGQRIVARLDGSGFYADERVMKRLGGSRAGELLVGDRVGERLEAGMDARPGAEPHRPVPGHEAGEHRVEARHHRARLRGTKTCGDHAR